ncbi:MAG: TolC family outer membrane protein [Zoogloea sp.]|nr:TolC family outer membrane protein [Zoogloea sp.]
MLRRSLAARLAPAALAALIAFTLPARADTPPRLDLDRAWQAALANDAVLRAARAGAESGREAVPLARAQLLPQVGISWTRNKNELETDTRVAQVPVHTRQDYYSSTRTLTIRQPLIQPVQWATLRQAGAQVVEAEALLVQTRQQLATRLVEAYFELLLADEQIMLIQAQTDAHTSQLDAARKSFAAGSGIRTEIDEAQARLDLDAAQALEARQQSQLARRRLQQLVAEPFSGVARLDPERLRRAPPVAGELDSWLALAEENSPEMQALRARLEAASQELAKARARHLPTLDAVAQANRGVSDNINRIDTRSNQASIGLQFNMALFSGGAVDAAVRQARAELTRAEENLAVQRQDLSLRLHREHRGVTEGLLRIKALEQAVASAAQLSVSSRRAYQAGARTTLDVLNAEQQLHAARRDLAQARYATLAAHVRLQVLAGAFDDDSLARLNALLETSAPLAAGR